MKRAALEDLYPRQKTRSGVAFVKKNKVYYSSLSELKKAHAELYVDEASFNISGIYIYGLMSVEALRQSIFFCYRKTRSRNGLFHFSVPFACSRPIFRK